MFPNSIRLVSFIASHQGICNSTFRFRGCRKQLVRPLILGCVMGNDVLRYSNSSNSRTGFETMIIPSKIKINKSNTYNRRLASTSTSTIASIEEKYTEEELETVLKTVNETNNPEDFKRFGISKKKVEELVKKKSLSGSLESIDDVISVLGVKSYNRFFCSILDRPSQNVNSPMFPVPTSDIIEKASSVLSVSITAGKVSWCLITRKLKDSTFLVESIVEKTFLYKPKMHFLTMVNEMTEMAGEVPKSQICIIEEYPSTIPTPYMFSFQLHMAQLRSAFLGSLINRPEPPQFISIKSIAVARLFKTYIGSEKVSGQYLVDDMIMWKPLPSLIVPEIIKCQYETADPKIKEGMSNVFLLNLAYWTLTKQFSDKW